MGFIFKPMFKKMGEWMAPKAAEPEVQKPTPTPTAATPAVEAAAESERRRQRRASGRAATMLTGSSGASTGMVGTKKLLGD